jgi:hypothetical protein
MAENIAAPLEQEGTVTQQVIQPAISGAEVTRLAMTKANALSELASGYQSLGQGIASGVDAAFKGIGAGSADNMARQGSIDGASSVTRDANGDIQVAPTTGSLFGLGGGQYAHAVSTGTQQQITANLKSDLDELASKNLGNPEGLKAGIAGYLSGHTGGLGAGQAGQLALIDARNYGQSLYDHSLNQKTATDINNAKTSIVGGIKSDQADLEALALGGMAGGDEFAKTLGHQTDLYNSLASNPAFGANADDIAVQRKDAAFGVTAKTIQGSMATAFQQGGINAAAAVIPSIDDYPGASDADKASLKATAKTALKGLQSQNETAKAANKTAFEAVLAASEKGNFPPLDILQKYQNDSVYVGDIATANAAANQITNHRYTVATSTLSPSQQDAVNGVGQPAPVAAGAVGRPNFFSSGRAADAGFNFDSNHPDLTTVTAANGLTAQVNKFAAPAFDGFIKDLEARGYNINDLGGYNNREKRGGTTLSAHAFGNAIDINPSQNTFGGNKTNMPPDVSQLAAKWGLSWGGDWQGKKDFMHFEWTGGAPASGGPALASGAPVEGSRSFVNSNPGNIKGDDFATSQGSTGMDAKGFAIFPNEAAGASAQRALWNRSDYANAPLSTALSRWSGNGYTAQQLGFQPNQTFASLSEPDKQRLLAAQRQQEGWVPGGTRGAGASPSGAGAAPRPTPLSWDDVRNNPSFAPIYLRSMAQDSENRTRTGSAMLDSSTRSLQNGILPSQENMTQIEQLATPAAMAASPALAEKYDAYSKEVAAYSLANQSQTPVGGGAGGQPLIDQARAAAVSQPDIMYRQVVDAAQKLRDNAEKLLNDNPVGAALNYKAIGAPPVPLDPTQPTTIGAHFAGNAAVVDAISAREPDFSKSVVFKNETGRFGAAMAGPAPVVNSILQSIYQLPQDKRDATLEMPEVKAAIVGAANSPDAEKKQVAFSFMNQVYHDDPQSFKGKFGADGLKDLMGWQDVEQFKTRDQIAKEANTANDASTIRAQETLGKEADKLLKGVTPADISNKLAPHWFQSMGFGDYTPVSDVPAQAKAALLDDYSRAYTDHYSKYGDATAADSYATRATSDKWGPSDANVGRVMAYPPERSPAYPQVNGSQDYIGSQLADFVAHMPTRRACRRKSMRRRGPDWRPIKGGPRCGLRWPAADGEGLAYQNQSGRRHEAWPVRLRRGPRRWLRTWLE